MGKKRETIVYLSDCGQVVTIEPVPASVDEQIGGVTVEKVASPMLRAKKIEFRATKAVSMGGAQYEYVLEPENPYYDRIRARIEALAVFSSDGPGFRRIWRKDAAERALLTQDKTDVATRMSLIVTAAVLSGRSRAEVESEAEKTPLLNLDLRNVVEGLVRERDELMDRLEKAGVTVPMDRSIPQLREMLESA